METAEIDENRMTCNGISGNNGGTVAKAVDEMVRFASACNAGASTFSAVRPDGWTVEITVKAPKEDAGEQTLKKGMEELLRRSVQDLELPERLRNILKAAGINDVGTLCSYTEQNLGVFCNFGADHFAQFRVALENLGLRLGMDLREYGYSRPKWMEEKDR